MMLCPSMNEILTLKCSKVVFPPLLHHLPKYCLIVLPGGIAEIGMLLESHFNYRNFSTWQLHSPGSICISKIGSLPAKYKSLGILFCFCFLNCLTTDQAPFVMTAFVNSDDSWNYFSKCDFDDLVAINLCFWKYCNFFSFSKIVTFMIL